MSDYNKYIVYNENSGVYMSTDDINYTRSEAAKLCKSENEDDPQGEEKVYIFKVVGWYEPRVVIEPEWNEA